MSLPARTLRASIMMGVFGLAVGVVLVDMMAAVAQPSLQKTVLPAHFSYQTPAFAGLAVIAWIALVVCAFALPLLINPAWRSQRIISTPGLAKLLAAALLVVLIALFIILGSDVLDSAAIGNDSGLSINTRIVFVLLAGLASAALVGYFGEGMAGGSPDAWTQPPATRVRVKDATLHGFLSGVIVALLAVVATTAGIDRLLRGLTSFLGESAEVSALGWRRLVLGFAVAFGLAMATLGGMLVAAVTADTSRRSRLTARSISIVPAAALLAVVGWFASYTNSVGEMNTTFAQAAGLDAPPPPRLMILSGPRVVEYPMAVSLPGDDDRLVGATEHNIQLAADYLHRTSHWTAHTVAARHLSADVHDLLLEPETALRERADAAELTGSILSTSVVLAKLKRMPRSAAVDEVTARLSDTAHFIGGAVRLQGEPVAARDRTVIGTIELPADLRTGARVALYRQATTSPPKTLPSPVALVAATSLDVTGWFSFSGLPAAIYSVGVLLPASARGDPRQIGVSGTLRVVDLSKDSRGDAGVVRVSRSGQ